MKKVLLTIVLLMGVFILTGCGNKKILTADEFYTTMKAKGFIVTDVTSQYSEYDHMKKVYVAQNSDLTYQIEFIEVSNEKKAKMVYDTNKQIFETSLGNVVKGKLNQNSKEENRYRATSAGHYMSLTRRKNTIIYARVPEDYGNTVKKIIKSIGY